MITRVSKSAGTYIVEYEGDAPSQSEVAVYLAEQRGYQRGLRAALDACESVAVESAAGRSGLAAHWTIQLSEAGSRIHDLLTGRRR